MKLRLKILSAVIGLAAIAGLGLGAGYLLLHNDSPARVSLAAALQSVAESTASTQTSYATPASSDTDAVAAGTWSVVQGASSFVGYRVNETLGGIGATTAVGRTQDLTGSLVYQDGAITAVQITADLTTLTSDKPQRDDQLKTQAIETNKYPTATFTLTTPIVLADLPADGGNVTRTVTGQLTLHGVTQTIQLDIQGVLQNGQLIVVGSTEIQFADFNISQPKAAAVLSIADQGTLEFQLVFAPAAS